MPLASSCTEKEQNNFKNLKTNLKIMILKITEKWDLVNILTRHGFRSEYSCDCGVKNELNEIVNS